MADTIYKIGKQYAFKCPCGHVEGGFLDRVSAEYGLRLHQIGCKKS